VTGISDLATILTVLTGLIACAAFLAATGPGARLIIFLILSVARWRTVVRAAAGSGLAAERSFVIRAVREIVNVQYTGAPYNLATEMEWLCQLYQVSLPIVMTGELADRKDLQLLATGYERLAGHCRTRLIFGAKGNDVISRQARVADQAAVLLHQHSLHIAYGDSACPQVIDRRAQGAYIKLMYAAASMECVVSPHPARQPPVPGMLERASSSAKPRFEGILPLLLMHRLELDGGSGRTLLHLGIGEIPYSNLLSRNTPWDPHNSEPPAGVVQHAISLAVIPVTSDGRILLSRRAQEAGSYAGMIGPYVTGNAELRDRRGLAADRDEYGIPDLLRAACREGKEEVGLSLEPSDLKILGLAQIWSAEDTGIYCLLLSATLPMTVAEAVRLTRYSDPVEGSWEVGNEVYAVSLWEEGDRSVLEVLRWITAADEVIPQAVACVVALANKTSAVTMTDLEYAADSHSGKPDRLISVLHTYQPYC
jgi:hypothetical protein